MHHLLPLQTILFGLAFSIFPRNRLSKKPNHYSRFGKTNQYLTILGDKLSAATFPKEVALAVVEIADNLLGWDSCGLDTYSEEMQEVKTILLIDTIDGERREFSPAFDGNILSPMFQSVVQHGAQLILRNQKTNHKNLHKITTTIPEQQAVELIAFGDTAKKSASLMFVPIRKKGKNIGILTIQSYTANAYDDNDLNLLQVLADYCSGALERTEIELQLRKKEIELLKNEEQYRTLIENVNIGVYRNTGGPEGRFIQANPALIAMHGYDSLEEF